MMKHLKKTLASIITAGLLLSGMFVLNAGAAAVNLLVTTNTQGETDVTAIGGGAIDGDGRRFCDGTSFIVYKLPLAPKSEVKSGKAFLIMSVDADYDIQLSESTGFDGKTHIYNQMSGARGELKFDLMPYINAGRREVYVRLGDKKTSDGNGGRMYWLAVVYNDYTVNDPTPITEKKDFFECAPGTPLELRYIAQGGGQIKDSENLRFCDATDKVTYRIPYDSKKDAKIFITVSGEYEIWISEDNKNFTQIFKAPKKEGSTTTTLFYDCKKHKGKPIDFLYLRVGDVTTNDGWGGCVYLFGIAHAPYEGKLYDPYKTTGTKTTGPSLLPVYYLPGSTSTVSRPAQAGQSSAPVNTDWEETQSDGSVVSQTSGKGVIKGRLFDDSGKPLAGMSVVLHDSGTNAVTDSDGQFEFSDAAAGLHVIGVIGTDGKEYQSKFVFGLQNGETVTLESVFNGERLKVRKAPLGTSVSSSVSSEGKAPAPAAAAGASGGNGWIALIAVAIGVLLAGGAVTQFVILERRRLSAVQHA